MKKILAIALALCLAFTLVACGGSEPAAPASSAPAAGSEAAGSEAAPAELVTVEEGKLIMSTNCGFPPYEMLDDAGNPIGIDVEISKALGEKLGLEVQIDDMDFDAALLAAQNGKSDIVLAGVSVTEDRLAVMDFTDSYATGIQSIVVPEGSEIKTVDDLAGKLIGVQRGTTSHIYCTDDFGEDAVVTYDNGLTAVQALMNGQVDCVVVDDAPAQAFKEANPSLQILETKYAVEDYSIGLAKGNTALKDALNAAIAELKADGTIDAIIAEYIPAE